MKRNPMLAIGLALAFALAAGGAQAQNKTADKASQKFISNAIEGNYAEIEVGKLAQEKGKSDAVKQFGQMLVTDHSAANETAKQVASEIGVTPPTGASVGEKATYLRLKMLSGDTFDRAFARAIVSDHKSDIKAFQKEVTKNDPAGEFAKQTLPTLQKHLQSAQQLQQKSQTTGSK